MTRLHSFQFAILFKTTYKEVSKSVPDSRFTLHGCPSEVPSMGESLPTKCPLAKPVCLMLTNAFPNMEGSAAVWRRGKGWSEGVHVCGILRNETVCLLLFVQN